MARDIIKSCATTRALSKNAFVYSDEFFDEIHTRLKELKKLNLSNDKDSENSLQIKPILGKSFEENELNSILDLNEEDFENEIKNRFYKKRSEREKILSNIWGT